MSNKGQLLQDPFLNTLRKEHVPVSIYLVNGIKLQGQIESFDQYVVLLRNSVTQMVYKHAISTGQDVTVSIALKPTSSIRIPRRTIDVSGNPVTVATTGRHDPCVGIRATPIAEAMLACVLADHALRHRAQCADVTPPTKVVKARKIN